MSAPQSLGPVSNAASVVQWVLQFVVRFVETIWSIRAATFGALCNCVLRATIPIYIHMVVRSVIGQLKGFYAIEGIVGKDARSVRIQLLFITENNVAYQTNVNAIQNRRSET